MTTTTQTQPIDIHCRTRKHARLIGDRIIEVHCRWCSKQRGKPVMHAFDKFTGEMVDECADQRSRTAGDVT